MEIPATDLEEASAVQNVRGRGLESEHTEHTAVQFGEDKDRISNMWKKRCRWPQSTWRDAEPRQVLRKCRFKHSGMRGAAATKAKPGNASGRRAGASELPCTALGM